MTCGSLPPPPRAGPRGRPPRGGGTGGGRLGHLRDSRSESITRGERTMMTTSKSRISVSRGQKTPVGERMSHYSRSSPPPREGRSQTPATEGGGLGTRGLRPHQRWSLRCRSHLCTAEGTWCARYGPMRSHWSWQQRGGRRRLGCFTRRPCGGVSRRKSLCGCCLVASLLPSRSLSLRPSGGDVLQTWLATPKSTAPSAGGLIFCLTTREKQRKSLGISLRSSSQDPSKNLV